MQFIFKAIYKRSSKQSLELYKCKLKEIFIKVKLIYRFLHFKKKLFSEAWTAFSISFGSSKSFKINNVIAFHKPLKLHSSNFNENLWQCLLQLHHKKGWPIKRLNSFLHWIERIHNRGGREFAITFWINNIPIYLF